MNYGGLRTAGRIAKRMYLECFAGVRKCLRDILSLCNDTTYTRVSTKGMIRAF